MMMGKFKAIASSSGKDKENPIEGNGKAQTQDTASAESWLGEVKRRFDSPHNKWQVSKNVCIYRVPKPMRISEPEVFDPFIVSLGPFHHNMNNKLSTMDEHKIEAVYRTLARTEKHRTDLIDNIRGLKTQIEECYEEPIHWDEDTLSWVFAMDGCFILEFFRTAASRRTRKDCSSQSGKNCSNESEKGCFSLVFQNNGWTNSTYYGIVNDIMKMENQIPLFVLKSILKLEFTDELEIIVELCTMLLDGSYLFEGFPFLRSNEDSKELQDRIKKLKRHLDKSPKHLLDLYSMVIEDLLTHSNMEPASLIELGDISGTTNMNMPLPSTRSSDDSRSNPSAELLHTAGIEFEPGQIRFRKRRFVKSTLSLPQITVDGSTGTLLRNLMAYEECQRCSLNRKNTAVSQFVILLDYLIDSAKDVSVLRKARVISILAASDKDIACQFNNITQGITVETHGGVKEVMKMAREHYDSRWNVWISQIQEEHCSRPWYVVPVLAGILLLVMTAVQTLYTVMN